MYKEKFEIICCECSELFESEDEEMIMCPKCWNNYLQKQLNSQTPTILTNEYLESLGIKIDK